MDIILAGIALIIFVGLGFYLIKRKSEKVNEKPSNGGGQIGLPDDYDREDERERREIDDVK